MTWEYSSNTRHGLGENMLKHIHASELKPGMYIANPGIDWTQRPYLYTTEGRVDSQEFAQRIIDDGYQEVYIDLARSDADAFTTGLTTGNELTTTPKPVPRPVEAPLVALEEELPKAVKVHDESVVYARRFMNDMRAGKLDISQATKSMENIMGSLERNADALISLSRLHQTDSYTYTHCVNVCILTTLFSRHMGESADKVFASGLAGMFHDLGKALVPLQILNAPRKLSDAEFAVMKGHPLLGHEQLAAVPGILPEVLMGAVQHHEKHNGTGYPYGLAGQEISDIGRMVGVADVYDALTSRRPYKGAMYPHKALGIMYEMRDKDFHHDHIAQFVRMVGIYPVGSVVELEDGSRGVVSASNVENPSKPVVTLVVDPTGRPIPAEPCDLARDGAPCIACCLAADVAGIDPNLVLGVPT